MIILFITIGAFLIAGITGFCLDRYITKNDPYLALEMRWKG